MSWLRGNLILLVAVALGIALGIGALRVFDQSSAPPIIIRDSAHARTISVQVGGAVLDPGVYQFDPDARLGDAIEQAGGAAPAADLAQLNLARRLQDGEAIEIPEIRPTPGPGTITAVSNRININTASTTELDTLPRIGPALADAIVEYRTVSGQFTSIDQLARVPGISPRMVDAMRDLITV